ncbi:MAG: rRNA maturation RNase YbeY [Chloroflexi bacterium]|nr:rRNA maturation RNase YbeY [Chloroflexota bacterium]
MEIDVQVEGPFRQEVAEEWLRETAQLALERARVPVQTEVGLVLAGDDTVASLNRQYRGMEGTTDVLAFALMEGEEPFVAPPDGTTRLGEVIISFPQAQRQAQDLGHSVREELCRLLVHGLLHLLGYDHETPQGRARMRRRERTLLSALGARGV